MKQLLFFTSILLSALSATSQGTTKKETTANQVFYPYTATYSSQYGEGKPEYAKIVLELWREREENAIDKHTNMFADDVRLIFANGQIVKGKENAIAATKLLRNSLASVTISATAWLPFKSLDRNQEWVAAWYTETSTNKDGKTETVSLHEIYRFNEHGKINLMRQYVEAAELKETR
jgi:hypothetical protein